MARSSSRVANKNRGVTGLCGMRSLRSASIIDCVRCWSVVTVRTRNVFHPKCLSCCLAAYAVQEALHFETGRCGLQAVPVRSR